MKYADLIRAALDGKIIQGRLCDNGMVTYPWVEFGDLQRTVMVLASPSCNCEYRIKPEPKPDVVYYDCIRIGRRAISLRDLQGTLLINVDKCPVVKLTINGETGKQTVEIVENVA